MKSIYGCEIACNTDNSTEIVGEVDLLRTIFLSYIEVIDTFQEMIDILISVNMDGVAPFIGEMKVEISMPFVLRVRLLWMQDNPGVQFDAKNKKHTNNIKDYYLRFMMDWRTDPLFKKPDAHCKV